MGHNSICFFKEKSFDEKLPLKHFVYLSPSVKECCPKHLPGFRIKTNTNQLKSNVNVWRNQNIYA